MPHTLEVETTPPPASKRQRSADGSDNYATPGPASSTRSASRAQSPALPVKIPAFLNKSRGEIHNAFEELDWNQRFRLQDAFTNPLSPFKIDRNPTVIQRNRYANVQPWDSSRIKLKTPIGGSDYVNASPIKLKSLSTPNSSQKASSISTSPQDSTASTEPSAEENGSAEVPLFETKYIATQGPKNGHFSHFWHMVMQEIVGDVGVIVMLTTCYEGNKEKCSQYFPADMNSTTIHLAVNEAGEDHKHPIHGDPFYDISCRDADTDSDGTDTSEPIPEGGPVQASTDESSDRVVLLSVTRDTSIGCEVREMTLEIAGQSKKIYHYLFSNWPDYGKPEAEDRKALLELVKQSAQRTGRPDNPRFVHCSAGVGRTGTFIALDHLLQELENGNLVANQANFEAVAHNARTPTWGRSGPSRESTPEGKEDLIYETVDKLREQRMMMVMNELQLCFLYEVLKEAFFEKYSRKPGQSVTEEVPPKVPRLDKPTVAEEAKMDATEGNEELNSDAETEVMDVDDGGMDPYDAVAPESIRQGQERTP